LVIDLCSEAGEAKVLAAMTQLGEEQITTVTDAGEYLSAHVPEDGPVGDGGALHALTHGWRGGPVQCAGCQKPGHIIGNYPHKAQGTSAPGATLTYNWSNTPHQRTDTCAQDRTRSFLVTGFRPL